MWEYCQRSLSPSVVRNVPRKHHLTSTWHSQLVMGSLFIWMCMLWMSVSMSSTSSPSPPVRTLSMSPTNPARFVVRFREECQIENHHQESFVLGRPHFSIQVISHVIPVLERFDLKVYSSSIPSLSSFSSSLSLLRTFSSSISLTLFVILILVLYSKKNNQFYQCRRKEGVTIMTMSFVGKVSIVQCVMFPSSCPSTVSQPLTHPFSLHT